MNGPAVILKASILVVAFAFISSLSACGKKGPLKPPEDVEPGVSKISVVSSKGGIFVTAGFDDGVMRHEIERIESPAGSDCACPGKLVGEGDGRTLAFFDPAIAAGTRYRYRVIPVLVSGKRGKPRLSNALDVTVVPAVPGALSATVRETRGAIELTWTADACDEYRIYRSVGDGSTVRIGTAKNTTFIDELPLLNVPLAYEVRCIVGGVEGAGSPRATATLR